MKPIPATTSMPCDRGRVASTTRHRRRTPPCWITHTTKAALLEMDPPELRIHVNGRRDGSCAPRQGAGPGTRERGYGLGRAGSCRPEVALNVSASTSTTRQRPSRCCQCLDHRFLERTDGSSVTLKPFSGAGREATGPSTRCPSRRNENWRLSLISGPSKPSIRRCWPRLRQPRGPTLRPFPIADSAECLPSIRPAAPCGLAARLAAMPPLAGQTLQPG